MSCNSQYIWIKATYQNLMDKEDKRCNSLATYSFTKCIRQFVSDRVGCRSAWDPWSDASNCTTAQQILDSNKIYVEELDYFSKLENLVDKTGCLPPCRFAQYTLSAQPLKFKENYTKVFIKFSSSNANKRTEILLFPPESLFSELGGALGLLLGFSVLMVWDTLENFMKYVKRSYQTPN